MCYQAEPERSDPSRHAQPPAAGPAFPHGRVACPFCAAHNDAESVECRVCGRLLPVGLPLIDGHAETGKR